MKHIVHVATTAITLVAGLTCAAAPAFAAGRCDHPNGSIESRACAKAAAGPVELRRFVERTRTIYGLYYYDFAPSEANVGAPVTLDNPGQHAQPHSKG